MTKQEAIDWADGSITILAQRLGITPQAISQWDDNEIPMLRELQIQMDQSFTGKRSERNG